MFMFIFNLRTATFKAYGAFQRSPPGVSTRVTT